MYISVLAHEDGCVRVVEQITCQVRKLRDDLPGDLRVSLRRDEDTKPGRGEQSRDEVPRRRRTPWSSHYPRVSRPAQKLVQDRLAGIPGIRTPSLALKPVAASGMKRRVSVGSVRQYVSV